jgi:hypothetical protein
MIKNLQRSWMRDREESEGLRPFPKIADEKSRSKAAGCQHNLHRFVAGLKFACGSGLKILRASTCSGKGIEYPACG